MSDTIVNMKMKNTILFLALIPSLFFLMAAVSANPDTEEYFIEDWSYQPNDFINLVYCSDIENDGVWEVIAGSSDGIVYNLGKKGTQAGHKNWEKNVGGEVKALKIVDFDGDSKKEILVAADKIDGLRILDYQGLDKGSTIEINTKPYDLDIVDIDDDGTNEVVIGAANKKIYILKRDIKEDKFVWEYTTKGPVHYVCATDLNGDGDEEIIAMSKWKDVDENKAGIYVLNKKGELKWSYEIEGGIFTSGKAVDVVDLDNDNKKEIIVGTYKHGVDVLDCDGKLKWNYPTERLVNVIYTSDLNLDGDISVLVGARPYLYVVDGAGRLEWKSPVNTTIHSIHAADLDKDNNPDVLIGATRYIHILDNNGNRMGIWNYKSEIRGLTKAFELKEVDVKSIYSADIDNDLENEVIVGFGWVDDRMDKTYQLGDIRVFKVNKEYKIFTTPVTTTVTTTLEETETTTSLAVASTTIRKETTSTTKEMENESEKEEESRDKGPCCIPFLTGILGLAFSITLGIPYLLVSKKKRK